MNMRSNPQRTLTNRLTALHHIASLSPNRVSVADIAYLTSAELRTAQRTLQTLVNRGYLTGDGCKPVGYKFNETKRGDLGL